MTKTQTIPATIAGTEAATSTAQLLSPVVLGLQALAVNGKQAHWNVRGSNFIAIHELLDTLVANAQGFADLAAERIVALGLPIDARVATIAEKTRTAVPAGFAQWQDEIRAVIADMDAVLADVQAAIDGLDETDLTSQDVAIAIKAGLDKD
ncbi:MAG: DNA starvation/stationary phase protection protein, partial [Microbacterium sp.]